MSETSDISAFLKSLEIQLRVSSLNNDNQARVVQLLQKTNQFNLTGRRHSEDDLAKLVENDGIFGIFSYEDKFGPQGIISVVILMPSTNGYEIDTWLMSCRVFNRGVENAVHEWICKASSERELVGCFIPSEKNGLVQKFYDKIGFGRISDTDDIVIYKKTTPSDETDFNHQIEIIYDEPTFAG